MEPDSPQAETSEPFWVRVVVYIFAAFFFGAAALLAIGGAPAWAEWIAVVFLWTIVSLLYLTLVLGGLSAPGRTKDRAGGWKGARYRGAFRYGLRRLASLLFIAALFVSARPVLASLYLFLWLRGAFAFAVLACLAHAGIRVKHPLYQAFWLRRGFVYLLYAKPYRQFWKQVLPTCFWLLAAALALGLAFDALSMVAKDVIIAILWGTALSLLALSGLSFLFLGFVMDGGNIAHEPRPVNWPREIMPYLLVLLRLVFLAALCAMGLWVLAGAYLALILTVCAIQWLAILEGDLDLDDDEVTNPFPVLAGVAGLCLLLGPFLVLVSPVLLPILAYEYWCKIRMAKDLCGKFDKPGGLIYLLYSEPHQYEHFLGEGGVLAPYGDQVVARNWRTSVRPAREGPGWEEFEKSAEGRLLEHFEISRLRHHLPFVVVIPPSPWLKDFQMSKVYRTRRRDKGAALRKLEERIKKVADKALGVAAT